MTDFIVIAICCLVLVVAYRKMIMTRQRERGQIWYVRTAGGKSSDPSTWTKGPRGSFGDYWHDEVPGSNDRVVMNKESGALCVDKTLICGTFEFAGGGMSFNGDVAFVLNADAVEEG